MAEGQTVAPAKAKAPAAKAKPAAAEKANEEFEMTITEVPAIMQEMAEKGVAQAKEGYEKIRVAAEEATDLLEDTYESARQTTIGFNLKAIETAKENADATFAFMTRMVGVKSLAEAIELQSTFFSKQFDSFSTQVKDMQEMVAAAITEAGEPVKDMVEKAMKDLKVA